VAGSPTSIILNWDPVNGAAKYKIYSAPTGTGVYSRYVDETERNTYEVNNLLPDTTYYYKVSSVDTSGIEGPLSSMYAYAKTQPSPLYTITFDVNGGNGMPPPAQEVSSGTAITLPSGNGLSRSGYSFGGWNTNSSGTGIPYSAGSSYTVLGSITLYAMWYDPNSIPSYTVTFSANGGSGTPPASITQNFGTSFNLPNGSALTRSGYTFGGWSTSPTTGMGTTYGTGSSYTVSGDITLYALWNASNTPIVDNVPGLTLNDKFDWLQGKAQSDSEYNIVLSANASISPRTLSYIDSGRNNITIRLSGTGAKRTISLSTSGNMFIIGAGVTLDLGNNITLQGRSSNSNALVRVNNFGTLIMNEGSTITGNSFSGSGGGVLIGENGLFIMNGGTISGNSISGSSSSTSGSGYGGGVCVDNGTFTMNNGIISGNTASSYNTYGGGVAVYSGTFTMNGGSIFGNTVSTSSSSTYAYGGGVYVRTSGTFNMNGGTISINTAKSTNASYTNYYGGGVYVSGKFTKTGGTIYGYSSTDSNSNVVSSGSTSSRGHAVYAYHSSIDWTGKDTTAGPNANLSWDGSTGEFSGDWDF
jgi:hypothetical protein